MSELEREIVARLHESYTVEDIASELECSVRTVRRVRWQISRKALSTAPRQSTKDERTLLTMQRGIERRRREIVLLENNMRGLQRTMTPSVNPTK